MEKKIIESIKANNKTDYPKEILEEIAQTLLNRIIFIRTVEDRKLEAHNDETIKQILNQYDTDQKISIKDAINKLFVQYDTVYDSKLFTYNENNMKDRHISERVEIDNKTYYKILRETYDKDDIYSYKFDKIDADILGQMYEKYISKIQKAKGIYYTPTYVVNYIVNNSIRSLIKNKKIDVVDKIKVLDMSCGSGSFLIKAFDVFNHYYKIKDKSYHQTNIDAESESHTITRRTKILKNNIYGVDLDKKAVEIAQLNLLLKIAETRNRLPDLRNNIQQGDSLIDDKELEPDNAFIWTQRFQFNKDGHGFDVVIGNPPWVSFGLRDVGKLNKNVSEFYRQRYTQSAEYKLSTYALFMQGGIDQLKDGGYLSFILPDSFLLGRYFSKIRRYILDTCEIKRILLTFYDVFSDKATTGRNAIIILKKESNAKKRLKNTVDIIKSDSQANFERGIFESYSYKQQYFEKIPYNRFRLFFNKEEKELVEHIERGSKLLSKFMTGHTGVRSLIGQKQIVGKNKNGETWKNGLISGSQIGRYWLKYDNDYINIDPKLLNKGGWDSEIILNEKIMIRQTGDQIYATLDTDKYYHLNNIHSFNLQNNILDIKYILGLLNSKLMSAYYMLISLEKKRTMAQTDIETLEKLPIKELSLEKQRPIIELVDKVLTINKKLINIENTGTDKLMNMKKERDEIIEKIDNIIYKLYGITDPPKIEIIKKQFK